MHIVFLNQYARPAGAAGITRHADIGAELVRRGHEVTIVASRYDYLSRTRTSDTADATVDANGVRYAWLSTGTYSGNDRGRVLSMVRYGGAAARTAMRLRPGPDVLVGSSPSLMAPLAASVAARHLGLPWVFEVRDFWPSALVDLGAIREGGPTHRVMARPERSLYRHANRIVSVPPNGALRLQELGIDPGRLVHVPNGSAPVAGPTALPESLSRMVDELDQTFLIVYTGSLGVTHDLQTVLHGLSMLERRQTSEQPIGMVLVGAGVDQEPLERLAQSLDLRGMRFHPPIPKTSVPAILQRSSACLMQAGAADYFKYGLSPNKLFDYFAAGKPVLIASAHPTVVDETETGIRFEPGDPSAFAAAVIRMMELPEEERRRMGERGRELIRTRFLIAAITDTYESLLEGVIAERRQ